MKTSFLSKLATNVVKKKPGVRSSILLILAIGLGSWWQAGTDDRTTPAAHISTDTHAEAGANRSLVQTGDPSQALKGSQNVAAAPAIPSAPSGSKVRAAGEQDALWASFEEARHRVQTLTEREAAMSINQGVRFFAANPRQQITARFLDAGVRIESGAGGNWQGTLQTTGLSRGTEQTPLADVTTPVAEGSRVEYRRGALTEWYENKQEGIEHGVTVTEPIAGDRNEPLRVDVRMPGLTPKQAGPDTVHWLTADTTAVLSYSHLKVWDANGKPLAAEMKAQDNGVAILVADRGAAYPLTIDPLIATLEQKLGPEITGSGAAEDAFGASVALSNDTALVGMPGDDTATGEDAGSAYVFVRTGSVWAFQARLTPNGPPPNGALEGDQFGFAVALSGNTALVASGRPNGIVFVFVRGGTAWSQQAMLTAGTVEEPDVVATSVAIDGDTAAVGTSDESVYVYVRTGTNWTEQADLFASDAMFGNLFGTSVAISGDTIVVGAPGDGSFLPGAGGVERFMPDSLSVGAAYVFTRNNSEWTEQEKLTAGDDAASFDFFGHSVAVSGNTTVIGAPGDTQGAGSAYVFVRNSPWTLQQKLTANVATAGDGFGGAVAVAGDHALVGAAHANKGYVFDRILTNWSQQAILRAGDATGDDMLGAAVALSADTAVIGAPGDDNRAGPDAGIAFVFALGDESCCAPEEPDTAWCQQGRLSPGDAAVDDNFGRPLALEGDTAVIGALGDDSSAGPNTGAVYVFAREGTTWTMQARLVASDAAAFDTFGWSVAIRGNTLLTGAIGDDTAAGADAGSAYIFIRTGTIWTQAAKLLPKDPGAGDSFGRSVALETGTALIGSVGDDTPAGESAGSAYVFTGAGQLWTQKAKLLASDAAPFDLFGQSVALSGNTALIGAMGDDLGAPLPDAGSAYVFVRTGLIWTQQAKLIANDCAAQDFFGHAVALSGETALVGADSADTAGGMNAGAAYVFLRNGVAWGQQQKLTHSGGAAGDVFGQRVALFEQTAVIGAPGRDTGAGEDAGSAFVFTRSGTVWNEDLTLAPADAAAGDLFGSAVAVSGKTVLVGAQQDDGVDLLTTPAPDQGSVYVFRLWLGNGPEIVVEQPTGSNLVDGSASVDFGQVVRGNKSERTFQILSCGTMALTGIRMTIDGTNSGDFKPVAAPPTTLDPGGMAPFVIVFTPGDTGPRQALLHIASNDADENPFDIILIGHGLPPEHPQILDDLQDKLVAVGAAVKWVASVTGEPPPKIVWKRNGGVIPKANLPTLSLRAALTNAGLYQVMATNSAGVASSTAELGVVDTSVKKLFKCVGETATMVVNTAGNDLSHTWLKNDQPVMLEANRIIVSANGKTLTVKNLSSSDTGKYACRVMGPGGTLVGGTHQLVVLDQPPQIVEPVQMPYGVLCSLYKFKIPVVQTPSATPTAFAATGLPKGLVINKVTGDISGLPLVAGVFDVVLTATNCQGTSRVETQLYIESLSCNVVGEFNGLVDRDGCLNGGFGGTIKIEVGVAGTFSGTLKLGPNSHPFSGKLTIPANFGPPTATVLVKRPKPLGAVTLAFKINPDGSLTGTATDPICRLYKIVNLAGSPESPGSADGTGAAASFNGPTGIARDSAGNYYVADTESNLIRKVTPKGVVTTLTGKAGLCGSTDGSLDEALFNGPKGLAIDAAGNLYVADRGNQVIRCITPQGQVITIAGSAGTPGSVDGTGANARFVCPSDLVIDSSGNLIVSDEDDHTLRKVTLPGAAVTTFAGKAGTPGSANGSATTARFQSPKGLALDTEGRIIVADAGNHLIRRVAKNGAVTTLAGAAGVPGSSDGTIANARFHSPSDVAVDAAGNILIADPGSNALRRLNTWGIVSTVAGQAGSPGVAPGIGSVARFIAPAGLLLHGTTLAITDAGAHLVRLGTPAAAAAVPVLAYRNPWGTDQLQTPAALDSRKKTIGSCYNPPAMEFAGTYNLAFDLPFEHAGDPAYPQGNGFITLTIASNGKVTWTGSMADGAIVATGSSALGEASSYYDYANTSEKTDFFYLLNFIPLHWMLYDNTGSAQGWQEIIADYYYTPDSTPRIATTETDTLIDGELSWMKIPEAKPQGRNYAGGIPLHTQQTFGERNLPPDSGEIVLNFDPEPDNAFINFLEGGLNPDFGQVFTITDSNTVIMPSGANNPNGVKFTTFNVNTSKFVGDFTLIDGDSPDPVYTRPATFYGVFMRRFGYGVGYFLLNQLPGEGPPPTTLLTSPILSGQVILERECECNEIVE